MFKVVQTVEDGEIFISAVPSSWEKDSVLCWPNGTTCEKKRSNPKCAPTDTWRKIPCVVKKTGILTFKEALNLETQLLAFSDTESEEL